MKHDSEHYTREWSAEHLVPEAISFVIEETIESLHLSDIGTETLSLEVFATRSHSVDPDTPLDYTWNLCVRAHVQSEYDDETLLERGLISEKIYEARQERRETGEPDDDR